MIFLQYLENAIHKFFHHHLAFPSIKNHLEIHSLKKKIIIIVLMIIRKST